MEPEYKFVSSVNYYSYYNKCSALYQISCVLKFRPPKKNADEHPPTDSPIRRPFATEFNEVKNFGIKQLGLSNYFLTRQKRRANIIWRVQNQFARTKREQRR